MLKWFHELMKSGRIPKVIRLVQLQDKNGTDLA